MSNALGVQGVYQEAKLLLIQHICLTIADKETHKTTKIIEESL